MAAWRFLLGWSESELRRHLEGLEALGRNFDPAGIAPGLGWRYYFSRAPIGREMPGAVVEGGPFEQAWRAVEAYEFSDPRIVTGHFDPMRPLLGRRMLLEIKVLGLRYLCGVVVDELLQSERADRSLRGFRYDTLDGHIESGFEWFVLTKDHRTGEIEFRIEAVWRPGQFPNFWSRLGFRLLALRYQRAWHRLAHLRLRRIVGAEGLPPLPRRRHLIHVGPELPGPGIWETSGAEAPPEARPDREKEGLERRTGWRVVDDGTAGGASDSAGR